MHGKVVDFHTNLGYPVWSTKHNVIRFDKTNSNHSYLSFLFLPIPQELQILSCFYKMYALYYTDA